MGTKREEAHMEIAIREERPEDARAVAEVNERAFGQPEEARLVAELRRRGASEVSLVAEREGKVVGHILFTRVTLGDPRFAGAAAGLAPMAVLPEEQRAGIGSALVRTGLARCAERGFAAVVVLGHPEYYPRFGFRPAHEFGLRCRYEVPPEAFMALELVPGALAGIDGVVDYHPAFDAVAEAGVDS
jgi:putative acetyltransferase